MKKKIKKFSEFKDNVTLIRINWSATKGEIKSFWMGALIGAVVSTLICVLIAI